MRLLSFLKRTPGADAPPKKAGKAGARASSADDVQVLRVRARRRLIGAAVLVGVGVIGFPLIFETQPRPMPVDLPIDIPRKDNAPPLAVPAASDTPAPAQPAPASEPAAVARAPVELPVEPAPKPVDKVQDKPVEKPVDKPIEKPIEKAAEPKPLDKAADRSHDSKAHDKPKAVDKPLDKPADKPAAKPSSTGSDGARAQALLEGRDPAPAAAAAARYIVQVGAFSENKAAQDVRNKVEKLGLKTYAQAVDTPDGRRVRVRLGPFASRDEAERAAAKLKGAGLAGVILTL